LKDFCLLVEQRKEGNLVWDLEELKNHKEIIDRIDLEMTPEKAVETYLEWGTGWARKDDFVRYAGQESFYFVIYDWEKPLRLTLIRRDMEGMDELARIDAPVDLIQQAIDEGGRKPGVGVYAINDNLREWLRNTLNC
jgi:hypothetical protein